MGHLYATLDTSTLRGKVGKGITVHTNDPARPTIRLVLRAIVLGSVYVLPEEQLSLGNQRVGGTKGRLLVRQDPTQLGRLNIESITTSASWLLAAARRLEQDEPAGDGLPAGREGDWAVEVELLPRAPYGRRNESVTFTTGLARQAEVTVLVDLDLLPPVQLNIDKLVLSATDPPTETHTVLLSVRHDLEPSLLRVEAEPPALSAELEKAGRRGFKLHVRWDGTPLHDSGALTFHVGAQSYRLPVVQRDAST